MNKIYLTILFVLVQNLIFAQTTKRTCGTMDLLAEMQQKDSTLQIKIDDFNKRIAQRIQSKATNKTAEDNSLFLIPVVVHVIHNGENIGEGMNISDEQIFLYAKTAALRTVFNADRSAPVSQKGSIHYSFIAQ